MKPGSGPEFLAGLGQGGDILLVDFGGGDHLQGMISAELIELGGKRIHQAVAEGGESGVIGNGVEGKNGENFSFRQDRVAGRRNAGVDSGSASPPSHRRQGEEGCEN